MQQAFKVYLLMLSFNLICKPNRNPYPLLSIQIFFIVRQIPEQVAARRMKIAHLSVLRLLADSNAKS